MVVADDEDKEEDKEDEEEVEVPKRKRKTQEWGLNNPCYYCKVVEAWCVLQVA